MSNDNSAPIDPVTGVPARPLRTFNDVTWRDNPAPAQPATSPELPPVEVDAAGKPKPRPLRTFNDVLWKR